MATTDTCPPTERVRASDVRPYEWAVWCSIEGGSPFVNHIVAVKELCGSRRFLLDTHNVWTVWSGESLDLIPLLPLADELPGEE